MILGRHDHAIVRISGPRYERANENGWNRATGPGILTDANAVHDCGPIEQRLTRSRKQAGDKARNIVFCTVIGWQIGHAKPVIQRQTLGRFPGVLRVELKVLKPSVAEGRMIGLQIAVEVAQDCVGPSPASVEGVIRIPSEIERSHEGRLEARVSRGRLEVDTE